MLKDLFNIDSVADFVIWVKQQVSAEQVSVENLLEWYSWSIPRVDFTEKYSIRDPLIPLKGKDDEQE